MTLNERRFYILTALANGPLHGYAIADEISAISDGHNKPRPGALYHSLDKLMEQNLLAVDREEVVNGRLRRYYRLTEVGSDLLSREATQRASSAKVALGRLNLALAPGHDLQVSGQDRNEARVVEW